MTPAEVKPQPLSLVIVTGMSGAGRSTTARHLEDLGWYVVDNIPPALLPTLADLATRSQGAVSRVAAVIDVRSRAFIPDVKLAIDELERRGLQPHVVFLEASDDTLVQRFEGVRRPHPLQDGGRVVDGIRRERELLRDLRGAADLVVDTSRLNVHELRNKIAAAFTGHQSAPLRVTLITFGYKYGLPVDADLVADCRLLPNPHWVPELRPLTGLDESVRDYVFGQDGATQFVDTFTGLLRLYETGYVREGKPYATVAVGCTGGKHRSVAIGEELAARLRADGVEVDVVHRDLGRE